LYEDHDSRFLIANWDYVPEANGQHDGGAPIIGPNVLLKPTCMREAFCDNPIAVRIDLGHSDESDGQNVGIEEVK
jgi:hypothetical protein